MSQDQIFPLRNEAAGIGLAVPEIIRLVNGPALTTSEPSALTIQATGAWSQKHLYDDPQLVIARLCAIFGKKFLDSHFPHSDASAHRWLYASHKASPMKTPHAIAMIKRWLLRVIGLRDCVSNRLLIAAPQPILPVLIPDGM